MSYRGGKNLANYKENYTLIEDLPELMDETNYETEKYIREDHIPSILSGMDRYHQQLQQQQLQPQQLQPQQLQPQPQPQPHYISCVEISEHCQNCPVCKKLYSSDNTLYIIAIVILAIICILLLKKVLDV